MKHLSKGILAGVAIATVVATGAWAAANFNSVVPQEFDPGHTFLVQAAWLNGIGCPTSADVAVYPATKPTATYTACATGDTKDKHNEGLLLAKAGPTNNNASATASLKDVKGTQLTELGYDIRKPGSDVNDPRGSHCGAGAPRFDITLQDGSSYFLGCNSPAPTTDAPEGTNSEWQRLRWGGSAPLMAFNASTFALTDITGQTVKSISIVFDEGQDQGPDNFGMAVLDNIDVNSVLVGHGPTDAS
jgi:hypothetical protein